MFKVKNVMLNKVNRKFISKYGAYSYPFYWQVKVKNMENHKSYSFKVTIDGIRKKQSVIVIFDHKKIFQDKAIADNIISEAKDLLINYLTTK